MKTKMNFLVIAFGMLFTLFASEKANAQTLPNFSTTDTICSGVNFIITNTSADKFTDFHWEFSQGGSMSSFDGRNLSSPIQFWNPGNQTIKLIALDTTIMSYKSFTKTIVVNASPQNQINYYPNYICSNDSVQVTVPSGYNYKWKLGNSIISSSTNNVFYAKQSGQYQVVMLTNVGCVNEMQFTIESRKLDVRVQSSEGKEIKNNKIITCNRPSLWANTYTTGIVNYWNPTVEWKTIKGNDTTMVSNMGDASNLNSGVYFVKVNNAGCITYSPNITVALTTPKRAKLIDIDKAHCWNTLSRIAIKHDTNFVSIYWPMSNSRTDTASFSGWGGTYDIFAVTVDTNGCEGYSDTIKFVTKMMPQAKIAISSNCVVSADFIKPTDWNINPIYYFYYRDSLSNDIQLSIQKSPFYKASKDGFYKIKISDSTSNCTTDFSESVLAECNKTTGINEANSDVLNVYPNPFTDRLNIESEIGSKIVIIDINGRNVYEGTLTSQNEQISIDTPPGIYILQISNGDKTTHQKILRE